MYLCIHVWMPHLYKRKGCLMLAKGFNFNCGIREELGSCKHTWLLICFHYCCSDKILWQNLTGESLFWCILQEYSLSQCGGHVMRSWSSWSYHIATENTEHWMLSSLSLLCSVWDPLPKEWSCPQSRQAFPNHSLQSKTIPQACLEARLSGDPRFFQVDKQLSHRLREGKLPLYLSTIPSIHPFIQSCMHPFIHPPIIYLSIHTVWSGYPPKPHGWRLGLQYALKGKALEK